MYGFSYLEAGRNVIQLFQNKGWTVIITDDLADNVLFMISVAIGLATGLVGLVLGSINPNLLSSLGFESVHGPAFLVGFLVGLLFSSVLLSVVGSAVNTVIVCKWRRMFVLSFGLCATETLVSCCCSVSWLEGYAEDPAAFERNHPQLSSNIREAWVQAWPGLAL